MRKSIFKKYPLLTSFIIMVILVGSFIIMEFGPQIVQYITNNGVP